MHGGEEMVLEIADNGGGIDPKDLPKLFDPFFSSKFTGRGLGLPVVLGIAQDGGVPHLGCRQKLCVDARRPDCSEKNESMTWGFQNPRVTIVVRQLTGAIARRIVAWAKIGDALKKGDRFGMIRLGSRTEVYLPLAATVLVKVGDHVLGGSTIIAQLPDQ